MDLTEQGLKRNTVEARRKKKEADGNRNRTEILTNFRN